MNHFTGYDSFKTTQLIAEANAREENRKATQKALNEISHGHDFGPYRKCKCGVTQGDYHFTRPAERPICKEYKG